MCLFLVGFSVTLMEWFHFLWGLLNISITFYAIHSIYYRIIQYSWPPMWSVCFPNSDLDTMEIKEFAIKQLKSLTCWR